MSLSLDMDEHVKSAVTDGLRSRGLDVLTVQEGGFGRSSDPDVLQRATDLDRLLFTQDDDFLAIAHDWQQSGRLFAGAAYAHQLDLTIGQAVRQLELICNVMTAEVVRNTILYLPL